MTETIDQITEDRLALVATLSQEMRDTAARIERTETALSELKAAYRRIEEERLPAAMAELGLAKITLSTGESVEVKPEVHASIPARHKQDAYQWLRENGFADLIGNKLTIEFARGQDDEATDTLAKLREKFPDRPVELVESVHHSRLRSFVREQFESGNPVPEGLFGVHMIVRAILKTK
jgi:hypothetical protein